MLEEELTTIIPSQRESQCSKLSVQASGLSKKCKSFKPVNALGHGTDLTNSLRRTLVKAHERYVHVSPKKLVYFKKKGRAHNQRESMCSLQRLADTSATHSLQGVDMCMCIYICVYACICIWMRMCVYDIA